MFSPFCSIHHGRSCAIRYDLPTPAPFRAGRWRQVLLATAVLCGPARAVHADPPVADGRHVVPGIERTFRLPDGTHVSTNIEISALVERVLERWPTADSGPLSAEVTVSGTTVVIQITSELVNALHEHTWEELLEWTAAAASADGVSRTVTWQSDTPIMRTRLWPRVQQLLRVMPMGFPWVDSDVDGDDARLRFAEYRPEGALSGRRIALSPGHGLYWTGSEFTTQRGDSFGLIEDNTTSIVSYHHIDPYLRGSGADVVWMRESARSNVPSVVIDAGDAGYAESGSWSAGAGAGGAGGNFRVVDAGSGATVVWTLPGPLTNVPVHVWIVGGSDRSASATYTVTHRGGQTAIPVDQRRGSSAWHCLGTFDFATGDGVQLEATGAAGTRVVADAARFGTSTNAIVRGGVRTNAPGWREASVHFAEFSGAPTPVWTARASVRDSDVVVRPLWANLLNVDLYVSIHTNAAGGTGTETYSHAGGATPGSDRFRDLLHTQVVADVRAYWNGAWVDRGVKTADFGELRELDSAPGSLLEIAFHDRNPSTGPDVDSLKSPRFRRIVGRAVARSIVRYFDADAPFVPEPPQQLWLQNTPDGLLLRWNAADGREQSGLADAYRVYVAVDGRSWDAGTTVTGTSLTVGEFEPGTVVSVRVAGVNAGGEGPVSPAAAAVSAGGQPAGVLLVQAFDRWDAATTEEGNTFDYLIPTAQAVAAARTSEGARYAADGATGAGFLDLVTAAGDYDALVWQAGEESTADETFSAAEQQRVREYVEAGGRLLVSGAEVGWDLWERGSETDRSFFTEVMDTVYLADDAGTWTIEGIVDTPYADIGAFQIADAASGVYNVDFPDVLAATEAGFVVLRYGGSGGAAVFSERTAVFGFPLEAVVDDTVRGRLMEGALAWLQVRALADDGTVADPEPDAGTRPDAGFEFDASELDTATEQNDTTTDIDASPDPGTDSGAGDSGAGTPDGSELTDSDRPTDALNDAVSPTPEERRATVHDGCGCSAGARDPGATGGVWLLAAVVLTALRRRRALV